MKQIEFNLEVNEKRAGKASVKTTPEGCLVYTCYVSKAEMNEIAWHAQHVHDIHPDWETSQALAMAMKIVLYKSEKNANKMNENGTN